MAPHGYIPFLQDRLVKMQRKPFVLEVGVDRGVTSIPLTVALASQHDSYLYLGVDIKIQESVRLMIKYLGQTVSQSTFLMEENSLSLLPKLVSTGLKFDLIILDGDHNYHTVTQELNYIDELTNNDALVVIDDYDGKWSTRDLWYSERPGYETNQQATKPIESEKQGVKPAVDDWLSKNPSWFLSKPMEGEPIILARHAL